MNSTSTYQCKQLTLRRRIYVGIGYRDYWLFDSSGNKLQPRIVRKGIWYYKVWEVDTCSTYYLIVIKRRASKARGKRSIVYIILVYEIIRGSKKYLDKQVEECGVKDKHCVEKAIRKGFSVVRALVRR
jgi:hypothetical protein